MTETLEAVKRVKEELGLKTVLGVSNISFGLPNRVLVNHIFLTMALQNGLDLPIINPNIDEMTGAVRAYKILAGIDVNSVSFIKAYSDMPKIKPIGEVKLTHNNSVKTGDVPGTSLQTEDAGQLKQELYKSVLSGLKNEGTLLTEKLLETADSMEIVNDVLIPALDRTGEEFEKGTLFLPQLIMAASVARTSFEVIRKRMASIEFRLSAKRIVIATVKGDVHDIGKNIVRVLLENYGYEVIDLGKDVPYETVVEAVKKYNVKLVGLSALMTTTLKSMKETIQLIHDNGLARKIMVGGAVLTPEYAKEIHADFYSKDAKESVDIAKRVFGN